MTLSQKILLLVLALYVIYDFTLGSLVGLYLWETTKSADAIVRYYATLFISIVISSQVASHLTGRIGPKKVYIASILTGMMQAVVLLMLGSSIANYTTAFGMLAGAAIGIQAMSYSLLVNQVTLNSDATRFIGTKSVLMNLVSIISVPLITGLVAVMGSYSSTYILSLLVGMFIIFLVTKIPISPVNQDVQSGPTWKLLQSDEVRIFVTTRLLYGIYNGPAWAILGVVTLIFVGDISTWGYVSSGLTILTIISTYLYSRISTTSSRQAISTVATFIFATASLVLATNWNIITFMTYQIVVVILNSSFAVHYESVIYSMVNDNETIANNLSGVLSLGEIALGLGRILPLTSLLLFHFSFDNPITIQILFVLISAIPLLIIGKLESIVPHSIYYARIHK